MQLDDRANPSSHRACATTTEDGRCFHCHAGAGTIIGSADAGGQWVFFFTGTTYLGTAMPSSFLALAGNPGPGQIAVSYTACAPIDSTPADDTGRLSLAVWQGPSFKDVVSGHGGMLCIHPGWTGEILFGRLRCPSTAL
jgi:hypothetical protein